MIKLKNDNEIDLIKQGGLILKAVFEDIKPAVIAGKKTKDIDDKIESIIVSHGGSPGFKKVPNYNFASCLCINDQVVHTPPSEQVLAEGDIFTIDCGVYFKGFHTDAADTFIVGDTKDRAKQVFLNAGKETLDHAIAQAHVGNRIGHISQTIDIKIKQTGYSIIKELTGHGIGRDLHEDPMIPGFLNEPIENTPQIVPGMVLAIEVIYAEKSERIKSEEGSRWSLVTEKNDISACFEATIAVTETKTLILT